MTPNPQANTLDEIKSRLRKLYAIHSSIKLREVKVIEELVQALLKEAGIGATGKLIERLAVTGQPLTDKQYKVAKIYQEQLKEKL